MARDRATMAREWVTHLGLVRDVSILHVLFTLSLSCSLLGALTRSLAVSWILVTVKTFWLRRLGSLNLSTLWTVGTGLLPPVRSYVILRRSPLDVRVRLVLVEVHHAPALPVRCSHSMLSFWIRAVRRLPRLAAPSFRGSHLDRWILLVDHPCILFLVVEKHTVSNQEVEVVVLLVGEQNFDGLIAFVLDNILVQPHVAIFAEVRHVFVQDSFGRLNLSSIADCPRGD